MDQIRSHEPSDSGRAFTDCIDFGDGLQTLDLDFSGAGRRCWPRNFESHLHGIPPELLCRLLHDVYRPRNIYAHQRDVYEAFGPHPPNMKPPPSPNTIYSHQKTGGRLIDPDPKLPMTPILPPPIEKPRIGYNYLQFSGSGMDAEPFICSGVLHPLLPQHDIPGWQRITMMKYFDIHSFTPIQSQSDFGTEFTLSSVTNGSNEITTQDVLDFPRYNTKHSNEYTAPADPPIYGDDYINIDHGCWAYEGAVLPGGMIMLGRWWSPTDQDAKRRSVGPFIFWNVDRT